MEEVGGPKDYRRFLVLPVRAHLVDPQRNWILSGLLARVVLRTRPPWPPQEIRECHVVPVQCFVRHLVQCWQERVRRAHQHDKHRRCRPVLCGRASVAVLPAAEVAIAFVPARLAPAEQWAREIAIAADTDAVVGTSGVFRSKLALESVVGVVAAAPLEVDPQDLLQEVGAGVPLGA